MMVVSLRCGADQRPAATRALREINRGAEHRYRHDDQRVDALQENR